MIKKLLNIAIVFISIPFLMAAAPSDEKKRQGVARVNGTELTEAELNETMQRIIPMSSFHRVLTEEKKAYFREKALDELIENELFYQEALKKGIKPDPGYIKVAVENTVKRLGGKKHFKAALKQENLTEKQYEKMLERPHLAKKLIEIEVVQKSTVTQEEIKDFYERNKDGYFRPESRALSHILISVDPRATEEERQHKLERAEEVVKKIGDGEDFGKLAWDYSDDPYRVKGGELGLIHRGRLDPVVEDAAFALQKGQISGVITSIYGYHIIRVDDIKEPEQLSLEDVSQRLEREFMEKKQAELRESLINSLRAGAKIEILN